MESKQEYRRRHLTTVLYALACLLLSLYFISVNSKLSFMYSFTDGTDVHCFFTTARCMLRGDVLYRDVYEHKGPVMYFLYCLALKLIPYSYKGAFLLEIISFAVYMFFSGKTVGIFVKSRWLQAAAAVIAGAVSSSADSFYAGGQCEEFALPLLSLTLYLVVRYYLCIASETEHRPVPRSYIIIIGVCFALVFWTKYTMVGMYAGLVAAIAVSELRAGRVRLLLCYMGQFLLGAFIGSLPVLIYFAVNGAFADLWHVYFYSLIVVYGGDKSTTGAVISNGGIFMRYYWKEIIEILSGIPVTVLVLLFASRKQLPNGLLGTARSMLLFCGVILELAAHHMYENEIVFAFSGVGIGAGMILAADLARYVHSVVPALRWAVEWRHFEKTAALVIGVFYCAVDFDSLLLCMIEGVVSIGLSYLIVGMSRRFKAKERKHSLLRFMAEKYLLIVLILLGLWTLPTWMNELIFHLVIPGAIIALIREYLENSQRLHTELRDFFSKSVSRVKNTANISAAILLVLMTAGACLYNFHSSFVSSEMSRSVSDFPVYSFAEYIRESGIDEPKVQCYHTVDWGLYSLLDVYPMGKYFGSYNLDSDEIKAGYEPFAENGEADFLMCTGNLEIDGYTQVLAMDGEFYYGNVSYYLYERNDLI